jgi:hypothetical protein
MGKIFQKLDENVRRFVTWVTFFGIVSTAMSVAAYYIIPISKYGCGAVVFAGVGAACIISLVASCALVSWRYFKPIPVQPNISENGGKGSIESNRRALIAEAREFVSRTVRQNPTSADFERQLASDQSFYRLRPYFSEHFKAVLHGHMVSYPSWEDRQMPAVAARFLDEIERLEKEWNLT